MTIQLFLIFYTVGSAISSLLTQAIKKGWPKVSSNLLAFISAIVVGGLGTTAAYILTSAEWTLQNIVCLLLMIFAVWLGSMVGYDKVIQLISQLKRK